MKKLFIVTIIVTLSALIAGFIVPPTGVIHPSVLTACGILSFIALLCQLPTILSEKRKTTFKVGQSSVTIEDLIKDAHITKEEFERVQEYQRWIDKLRSIPPAHYSKEFTENQNIINHE